MKVIIAGAGSVGRSIARELSSQTHDITLIDKMLCNESGLRS